MRHLIAYSVLVCAMPLYLGANGPKGVSSARLTDIANIKPENLAFETAEDGTKFVSLRLQHPDASAIRVHIGNMCLGAGQKLFLLSGDGSQTYGPFEGAGPVQTGEFWSEAIAGPEVIVEFQSGPEAVADLPFSVDALEAADLSDVPAAQQSPKETEEPVYEGDILIGNHLRSAVPGDKTPGKSAVAITSQMYRWPNGVMPYIIATNVPNQVRITDAIKHWNTVMAGVVQIVPKTTETNYVVFVYSANAGACSSYVGRTGFGSQPINVGNYCSTGNMIHEIGHAFGLWHEHTREDRDKYVKVNWANILSGQTHNFTQNIVNGDDLGVYDYNSVMHYNRTSFSSNGLPTIETLPAGIPIGQRARLSTGDIAAIRQMYPATSIPATTDAPPATATVQTVISSNPLGSAVIVDGVNHTTPVTLAWVPGSTHTLTAVNTEINGMRRTFARWSDAGLQTHVVTASTALPMLKADYAVAYSVKTKANPVGSVYLSPTTADGFYPAGTSVRLTANPAAGYCFTSWTGLIAGTPNRATLTATRAYDLQANFQPGAISLSASVLYPGAGGAGYTIGVNATSGCTWGAYSTASWATITAGQTGSGSGAVTVAVAPNTMATARVAQITVGYKSFIISQAGVN